MNITIKYDNGQMTIHMESFFPTSQTRLKKLLKIIDLDYRNQDEIIQTMQQYFQDRVQELEEKSIILKNKVDDKERIIASRNYPSGVYLTKDKLRVEKANLSSYKHEYNGCVKQKEAFVKHLEILEQRK